jgi:hypothetical protein
MHSSFLADLNFLVIKEFIHSKIYDFETRILKQAVRRNIHQFPNDFLTVLSKEEDKVT